MALGMNIDLKHLPILVFNGGSSSIKFSIYISDGKQLTKLNEGEAGGIGTPKPQFNFYAFRDGKRETLVSESEPKDLGSIRSAVRENCSSVASAGTHSTCGHRSPHCPYGAESARTSTDHARRCCWKLKRRPVSLRCISPSGLEIIREAKESFPGVENYACFDTIFLQDLPEVASIYPLPKEIRDQGVHRYGFHGLSCESIMEQFREGRVPRPESAQPDSQARDLCSFGQRRQRDRNSRWKSSRSLHGPHPCGGVIMGTRPGDLDPGLVFYLMRRQGGTRGGRHQCGRAIAEQALRHACTFRPLERHASSPRCREKWECPGCIGDRGLRALDQENDWRLRCLDDEVWMHWSFQAASANAIR